jgi:glutamyl-tRNA synthetase
MTPAPTIQFNSTEATGGSAAASPPRCRFAPSPTGYLHVGGARTALFNYLFARRFGGKHILRIEDTDRERSSDEATAAILDSLRWLKIDWDEGPFYQSERTALYHQYASRLLASGHAYRCSCTAEELEAMRAAQTAAGEKPQYDRRHRPHDESPQPIDMPTGKEQTPFVIRLRVPEQGDIIFNDGIVGEIRTALREIDDFIIVRSDGSPTYNFTVVVDDIDMQITHVIRGMDHISNTPKQIVIYNALGAATPEFAHVPMILGPDKKKLSKRHGATSVFEYKKDGYLADAFVNYLARLGWSHGDQEIFTRDELCNLFSLDQVGKSAAVFDTVKLLWVNQEHIKTASTHELAKEVIPLVPQAPPGAVDDQHFLKLVENLKPRSKSLLEIASGAAWYFVPDSELSIDAAAAQKHLQAAARPILEATIEALESVEPFTEAAIETSFKELVERLGIKLGALAQPVRVAVTGSSVSPPIYPVLEALGRDRSRLRLQNALKLIA